MKCWGKFMKRVAYGIIMLLSVMLFSGCGNSNYAKAEDIKITPAYWTTEGDFLGIGYTDTEGGVLLSNTSSNHAKVEVKAAFYDKDNNYVDEDSKSLTLKANEKWFLFFDIDDEVTDVKYSIETDAPFWEPALASDIELGYEDGKVIVINKSDKDTEACGFQYVFYDNAGNILYVDGGTVNDGYIPAGERVAEEYSLEYPAYLKDYEDFEVCIYCLFAK